MEIPGRESKEWAELVEGRKQLTFQMLATRILVGRIVGTYKLDPSPERKIKSIDDLCGYFKRNLRIPSARADLNTIFGGRLS
ncbi:MAG: hypothetical protein ACLQCB_19295 [Spirochaetia bacterium]